MAMINWGIKSMQSLKKKKKIKTKRSGRKQAFLEFCQLFCKFHSVITIIKADTAIRVQYWSMEEILLLVLKGN